MPSNNSNHNPKIIYNILIYLNKWYDINLKYLNINTKYEFIEEYILELQ